MLLREELIELTGYKRRSDQVRWLTERRIPFSINAAGLPVVSRSVANAYLGGRVQEAEPNWGAL